MRVTVASILLAFLAITTLASAQSLPDIYKPDPKFPEGFIDLDLKIESMDCPSWDNCTVRAKGLHRGIKVGLQVQITRNGRSRSIRYQSLGEQSDRFLIAMAQLYKVPMTGKRFRKEARADIVVLDANNDEMANKVFFANNGPRSDYAELYTNIDKRKGVLQIHEKDDEYRANVLKALAE
jgi:hypothetical protein